MKTKKGAKLMKLFLLMEPPTVTAQQAKVAVVGNRPMFYKPEKVKAARQMLIRHLRPFKPDTPYEGPLELHVIWKFPRGKRHKNFEWRVTKPDTDNLQKMLKDCMTEVGFWKDDALVVKEIAEKVWSDEPTGISIELSVLEKFQKDVKV
ncbi:MAG: RusA family crossover junction endodeoxyribonuclease [Bacilli bacterium]